MKNEKIIICIIVALFIGGCVQKSWWEPTNIKGTAKVYDTLAFPKSSVYDTATAALLWHTPDTLIFVADHEQLGGREGISSEIPPMVFTIVDHKAYVDGKLIAVLEYSYGASGSIDGITGAEDHYWQYHIIAPGEGNYINVYFKRETGRVLSVWIYSDWKPKIYYNSKW